MPLYGASMPLNFEGLKLPLPGVDSSMVMLIIPKDGFHKKQPSDPAMYKFIKRNIVPDFTTTHTIYHS